MNLRPILKKKHKLTERKEIWIPLLIGVIGFILGAIFFAILFTKLVG